MSGLLEVTTHSVISSFGTTGFTLPPFASSIGGLPRGVLLPLLPGLLPGGLFAGCPRLPPPELRGPPGLAGSSLALLVLSSEAASVGLLGALRGVVGMRPAG